jgi:hypothetical protein
MRSVHLDGAFAYVVGNPRDIMEMMLGCHPPRTYYDGVSFYVRLDRYAMTAWVIFPGYAPVEEDDNGWTRACATVTLPSFKFSLASGGAILRVCSSTHRRYLEQSDRTGIHLKNVNFTGIVSNVNGSTFTVRCYCGHHRTGSRNNLLLAIFRYGAFVVQLLRSDNSSGKHSYQLVDDKLCYVARNQEVVIVPNNTTFAKYAHQILFNDLRFSHIGSPEDRKWYLTLLCRRGPRVVDEAVNRPGGLVAVIEPVVNIHPRKFQAHESQPWVDYEYATTCADSENFLSFIDSSDYPMVVLSRDMYTKRPGTKCRLEYPVPIQVKVNLEISDGSISIPTTMDKYVSVVLDHLPKDLVPVVLEFLTSSFHWLVAQCVGDHSANDVDTYGIGRRIPTNLAVDVDHADY